MKGRDLMSEAVNDAKAIKEAAVAAAKNDILEAMAPRLRELVEQNIKGALEQNEGVNRMRRADPKKDNSPGESHTGFEESKEKGDTKMDKENKPQDDKELDLESLASFFPSMSEAEEESEEPKVDEAGMELEGMPGMEEGGIPTLGEGEEAEEGEEVKKEGKKSKEDDTMDETIEISESELKKVYEAALATEATVTKGFGDMTPAGELDDVVKDTGKGLNPEKKGEHQWAEEEPTDKKDFVVKEAIKKGLAENRALRESLKKAVGMIRALGTKLHEVNLFNAKVLHVNRVLNKNGRMTSEQKRVVLESIDKAKTIDEVKMVFEAISNSFAVSAQLSESASRKPVANSQRPRTTGTPNQKVLRESVDHESNTGFSRLQQLAGLGNLK